MEGRRQASAYPVQAMPRRSRNLMVLTGVVIAITIFVFAHVSKVDEVYVAKGQDALEKIQKNMHDMPRPFSHLHNPFKPQAHPPPVQKNSSWGEASWFSDWKWLNPFSSMITLDEDRALLPPLEIRPPIYTYYEPRDEKSEAVLKVAEDRLLGIWRRAWWAQGFKPIVLGPLEAMENPMYQKLQSVNATKSVETELMRWLAWSHMGDGILANWLAVPMAEYYQPTLTYLRAARYPALTRYQDLDLGLFSGAKKDIDKALNVFLDVQREKPYQTLMDAINENDDSSDLFHLEAKGKGVAFYSETKIKESYADIAALLDEQHTKGLNMLGDLITAHLHATFLTKYPDGLAVVSPYAGDATLLPHRALTLAHILNTCPSEPISAQTDKPKQLRSCPPNRKDCRPCSEVQLRFPPSAPNSTTIFTLGTVPHAYTLSRLLAPHEIGFNFSVPFIRRKTNRDPFVEAVTAEITQKGTSPYTRIVHFKESVAQPGKGAMRSIWQTAESDWDWTVLEWRLGFEVAKPPEPELSDVNGNPVPQKKIGPVALSVEQYPESLAPLLSAMREKPPVSDLTAQGKLMDQVQQSLGQKKWPGPGRVDMRKVTESWHLADSEAWRFVRALTAREELERKRWEDEEGRFRH